MNIVKIKPFAIEDGPGVRVCVFCSYCPIHCEGCQNSICWSAEPSVGFRVYDNSLKEEILKDAAPDYIAGLTLCGGEPFEFVNQVGFLDLVKSFHEKYPTKSIWAYTGYLWNDLLPGGKRNDEDTLKLLSFIDVLIEGPFILSLRDISDHNRWRGSTNQRVIDVKESLKQKKKVFLQNIPNNS